MAGFGIASLRAVELPSTNRLGLAWLLLLATAACDLDPPPPDARDTDSSSTSTGGSPPTSSTTGSDSGDGTDSTSSGSETTTGEGPSTDTSGTDSGGTDSSDTDSSGTEGMELPPAPMPMLSHAPIRRFDFSWPSVAGADHYLLEEGTAPGEPFLPLRGPITSEEFSIERPLHLRHQSSYRVSACAPAGCTESAVVDVTSSLAEAVGYVKASNPSEGDQFGFHLSLSSDGNTLAVAAPWQDDPGSSAGSVYVYARDGVGSWSQQAELKASNAQADDFFGSAVSLSADGSTLAVGAYREDSNATGIGGNQADDSAPQSGAAYVFTRDGMGSWSQQAYVKASNTDMNDRFGSALQLSSDGNTLVVGAPGEDGGTTGIDGNQADDSSSGSGAVYVLTRDGMGTWSHQTYIKASNTGSLDAFGQAVAICGDGSTLAVGADHEDSGATGIGGSQGDSANDEGAVYVFTNDGGGWSQQAYIHSSNPQVSAWFGMRVALSETGDTLATSTFLEASGATGIDGDQLDDSAFGAGAAYVFQRDPMGTWSQQAYVKASNTQAQDNFGYSLALSGSGDVLAVGAQFEASGATGIGGNQADDGTTSAGAVYLYSRDAGTWAFRSYVKAPNTGFGDIFGGATGLSMDGHVLAVGAYNERSNAVGVGGDQTNDDMPSSGAVYLY